MTINVQVKSRTFLLDQSNTLIRISSTALLTVLMIILHLRLSQFAFDDAYIHFRVARNLLDFGTPYFNLHEPIKVSTSSAWTIFLAILLSLTRFVNVENNFPVVISIINSFISIGGMLVWTAIIEELMDDKLPFQKRMFFQVSYLALIVTSSIGLMETSLALFVAGAGIQMLLKMKVHGFVFLGWAIYLRLELAVLLAFVATLTILWKIFKPARVIVFSAMGIMPFLVYDLYYFKTIIPHSIIAKATVYNLTWLHTFTRGILLSFPILDLEHQYIYFIIGLIILIGALLSIIISVSLSRSTRLIPWILLFALWSISIFSSYVFAHTLMFEWYTPLFTVPLLIAITLCTHNAVLPRNGVAVPLQLILFIIGAFGLGQAFYAAMFDPSRYVLFESGSRVKMYMEVGRILFQNYPEADLMSSEIGGLGYSFQGRILDAAGLATPGALRFHPMDVPLERARGDLGAIPPAYVEQELPDLIVSFDSFAQALINSKIFNAYSTILVPVNLPENKTMNHQTIWGNRYLRIYIRKDIPIAAEILRLGSNE